MRKTMELENVLKLITAVSNSSLTSFTLDDGTIKLSFAADRAQAQPAPVIEVRKDDDPAGNFSSHEGEEFVYVAEGEIELTYGDKKNILKTGDSVYYDSIVPHQINSLTEVSKLVAVMYMPW